MVTPLSLAFVPGVGKRLGGRGCHVCDLALVPHVRMDLVNMALSHAADRFIRLMYVYYISMYNVSIRARCHFVCYYSSLCLYFRT